MQNADKWATATLRIHSRTLNAQKISALLRTEPTGAKVMGERLSSHNPSSAIAEAHLWRLESGLTSNRPLEEHIEKLVEFIEQKLPTFNELMKECESDLFCGYSSESGQGGFILESKMLKRLAAVHVDLVLDIYSQ